MNSDRYKMYVRNRGKCALLLLSLIFSRMSSRMATCCFLIVVFFFGVCYYSRNKEF